MVFLNVSSLFTQKEHNVKVDKCFICLIVGNLMKTKQYNMSWLCSWFTSSTEKNTQITCDCL